MKKILLEEKQGLCEEDLPAYKSSPRKTKPCSRARLHNEESSGFSKVDSSYMAPINGSAGRKPGVADIKAGAPKRTRKFQCFICNEPVSTGLRSHMKTHFPSGDYACPRCDSRFKLFSSLRLHLHRTCFEHVQQRVDPAFGYKVLRDPATLARHKSSHTLFQCNRCEETFALFKPLLRHCENIHQIRRPFKCSYCPKVVAKMRVLIAHEWKHTGHLPFRCALCHLRFKSDAALASHERVHTRERPYLCAECGKTFSQRSNLLRHLNFIHSEARNKKNYSCSECENSFKDKGALKKHQKTKHQRELFRHPCPYCGKMVSVSSIARHKLIHTGEKPFKCTGPECDKCFRSASEVKRHVLIHHSMERPFKCDVCGKGFVKSCFLTLHMRTHTGERPYVCTVCSKGFSSLHVKGVGHRSGFEELLGASAVRMLTEMAGLKPGVPVEGRFP
uniref:C2H2-type domain-containing protein n=1 Tax=Cyclopterus lumpus TaxID=8103 RepID=A0A8C2WF07_CYCLU